MLFPSRYVHALTPDEGGIKMVDVEAMVTGLQAKIVPRYLEPEDLYWKLLNFESDRWCRRLCLYKSVQQSILISRKTINVCQARIHMFKVITFFLHIQGDIHRISKLARP